MDLLRQAQEDIERLTLKVEAFEREADRQETIIREYCAFLKSEPQTGEMWQAA